MHCCLCLSGSELEFQYYSLAYWTLYLSFVITWFLTLESIKDFPIASWSVPGSLSITSHSVPLSLPGETTPSTKNKAANICETFF